MANREEAYRACANINGSLCQRRLIPALKVGVPYISKKFVELPHYEKYGVSWRLHLRDDEKKHFFVLLTSRIVEKIGPQNLSVFQADVEAKKPPIFFFLGMEGNAYNVLIKPFDLSLARAALKGEVVQVEASGEAQDDGLEWLDKEVKDVGGELQSECDTSKRAGDSPKTAHKKVK